MNSKSLFYQLLFTEFKFQCEIEGNIFERKKIKDNVWNIWIKCEALLILVFIIQITSIKAKSVGFCTEFRALSHYMVCLLG